MQKQTRQWGRAAVREALQGIRKPKPYTPSALDRQMRKEELERMFENDMRRAYRETFTYTLNGKPVVATLAPEERLQDVIRATSVRVAWSYTGGKRVVVYPELTVVL